MSEVDRKCGKEGCLEGEIEDGRGDKVSEHDELGKIGEKQARGRLSIGRLWRVELWGLGKAENPEGVGLWQAMLEVGSEASSVDMVSKNNDFR